MPEWRNPEIAAMAQMMAAMAAPADAPKPSWDERRAGINAMGAAAPLPEGVTVEPLTLGGVPAEKLMPKGADATRTIVWLHGGGYCVGGCASHRVWAARMAEAAGAIAYTVDYRMAPEHPFPAAVDDALSAWRAVLASGVDPARTVI